MATFQCKRSGNLVSFTNDDDIIGLRKHEGYVEVKDVVQTEEIKAPPEEEIGTITIDSIKKRGRPFKVR